MRAIDIFLDDCGFDYHLVHNHLRGQNRDPAVDEMAKSHYEGCANCQARTEQEFYPPRKAA